MKHSVWLTQTEMMIAGYVGSGRNTQCLFRKYKPGHGSDNVNDWTKNIEGAGGEMAVAKFLGIYWLPVIGNLKADDAGPYQVRTNCSRRLTDTALHEEDRDDRYYIGVLCFAPRFDIIGFIKGGDGKKKEWWRDGLPGRPAFFVPSRVLRPMEELPTPEEIMRSAA
jgi:hypothetical protein